MTDTAEDLCDVTGIEPTFQGLHHWFKKEFHHLGWMVLVATNDKNLDAKNKIDEYYKSICKLALSLRNAVNKYEEKDRKRDLKIMYNKTLILMKFVKKNLCPHLILVNANNVQEEYNPVIIGGKRKGSRKGSKKGSKKSRK